jgi:hypothetical protein
MLLQNRPLPLFKLSSEHSLLNLSKGFALVVILGFMAACSSPTPQKPSYTGHWICKNAYLSVMDSMSIQGAALPPFELVFREGIDSMLFLNPIEIATFPVHKISDNQRTVIGFIRDSISTFTLSDDGNLHFVSGDGQMDFFKADSNLAEPFYGKWKTTLKNFYTEALLSGRYLQGRDSLSVSPMGVVKGSKSFVKLDLLLDSEGSTNKTDLVVATKANGEKVKIAWRISSKKLDFYTLQNLSNQKNGWVASQVIESWDRK